MEVSKQASSERQFKKNNRKRKNKNQGNKSNKNNNDGLDLLPQKRKITPKSSISPAVQKKVQEPNVKCSYCDKVITDIASSIKSSDSYLHFDCVIEKIKKEKNIKPNQIVSYIGKGSFAIIEKDEEGKMKFIETMQIETPQDFDLMKKYIEEIKI